MRELESDEEREAGALDEDELDEPEELGELAGSDEPELDEPDEEEPDELDPDDDDPELGLPPPLRGTAV